MFSPDGVPLTRERVMSMNQLNNLSSEQINALLAMAGKKLGRDPQQLRAELESGKLDKLMNGMDSASAKKVNQVLQDPEALKAALNNDKVKAVLNSLLGGRK